MKEDEELKREQIRQCSVLLPESFGTVQTGIASTNALLSAKLAVVLLYLAPSAPAFRGIPATGPAHRLSTGPAARAASVPGE